MSNHAGDLLKYKREAMDMTMDDVAVHLRVHKQSINNVEHGEMRLPVDWIPKLSKVLKIKPKNWVEALVTDYENYLVDQLR